MSQSVEEIRCPNCLNEFDPRSPFGGFRENCPSCGYRLPDEFWNDRRSQQVADDVSGGWTPSMPITTGTEIPGANMVEILGPIFAMTVRSRNIVSQTGAKLKSIGGGELIAMTKALEESRHQTLMALDARARTLGADAVIAMRFDVGEMAGMWTQVCAYGTAVRTQAVSSEG